MNPVIVKNIKIGEGIPKICVPVLGRNRKQIIKEANSSGLALADFVEWRADWFEGVFEKRQVQDVLGLLCKALQNKPVLFTFRTAAEGGETAIEPDQYGNLLKFAVQTGYVDMIDVELFRGDSLVKELIEVAHGAGVKVVVSNHEFTNTPPKDEIIRRLLKMKEMGADIPKIAVMPQERKDVLTLLAATEEMCRNDTDGPVITMAMGGMGTISRLCGEVFGSAVTFGAAGEVSAPGQIGVSELADVLGLLHKSLKNC